MTAVPYTELEPIEEHPVKREADGSYPKYAWPGGYPVFYVAADGGVLCSKCVNDPTNPIGQTKDTPAEWRLVGSDVNWESDDLVCDHCGGLVECAYPPDQPVK